MKITPKKPIQPSTWPKRPTVAHAYMAGPDVFMQGLPELVARKKAVITAGGIIPHFPLDNGMDPTQFDTPEAMAMHIAQENERLMEQTLTQGDVAVIFANMSPWHRSPSMDVGTAFEMGYYSRMAAQHPGRVLIMGYYDNPADRVSLRQRYEAMGAHVSKHTDGWMRDEHGHGVEDFDLPENLMMVNACRKTGGDVFASLETAVAAAEQLLKTKRQLTTPRAPGRG